MKNQSELPADKRQPEMMLLINELSKMFRHETRKVCEENGVPVGYRSLLFHLGHHDGISQRDLAAMTGLKASTVSIALDKMDRDGYITREKSATDGRAVRVFLTDKGNDINRKNKEKIDQLEILFADTVNDEEYGQMMMLLEKIIRNYCKAQALPLPPFLLAEDGEESGKGDAV